MPALNDPEATFNNPFPVKLTVLLDGKEIPTALSAEITSNNWYAADHFSVEFALFNKDFGPEFWGKQDSLLLDVQITVSDKAAQSLILGQVDHLDLDWHNGTVRLDGRDLTARFIDARMYEGFVNQTSSQIAKALAAKHEMEADVDETTTLVGRYYEGEHDQMSNGEFNKSITEWDLLTFLAQSEGDEHGAYNVWVSGKTLHFKKAVPIDDAKPWIVRAAPPDYQQDVTRIISVNAVDLKLQRALTLAKDIVVIVRSWGSENKHSITVSSPAGKTGGASSSTGKNAAQRYVFRRPNLTKDQAQKLADNLRADLSKHERVIEWTDAGSVPGALQLTPRDAVSLEGTKSSWDQRYYIDNISRHISVSGGLTMSVKMKNHTTESQTLA